MTIKVSFRDAFARNHGLRFLGTRQERDLETTTVLKSVASARVLGKTAFALADDRQRYYYPKLVWDTPSQSFKLRTDLYDGDLSRVKSFEADLSHATILSDQYIAGAIVDQVNHKIILPDGRYIDGPTGDIYNVHGDVLLRRDPKLAAQSKNEGKVC